MEHYPAVTYPQAARERAEPAPSADGPASRGHRESARTAVLLIKPWTLASYLAAIALVLAIVGAFANIVIYQIADSPDSNLAKVMHRLDLGYEPSLPAWFSSLVLFFNASVLLLISRAKQLRAEPYFAHWLGLGIIFVGLSIDESVMIHEMVDTVLSSMLQTTGFLLFPWVIAGSAFALTVLVAYSKFLLRLPRRFAYLFITSGALFVGGAVGMELLAGAVIDAAGVASIYHTIVQTIEESLEMAGSILFLYSLTEYWTVTYGPVRITAEAET